MSSCLFKMGTPAAEACRIIKQFDCDCFYHYLNVSFVRLYTEKGIEMNVLVDASPNTKASDKSLCLCKLPLTCIPNAIATRIILFSFEEDAISVYNTDFINFTKNVHVRLFLF